MLFAWRTGSRSSSPCRCFSGICSHRSQASGSWRLSRLRRYDIEEVIVATHAPERANWVETTILGRMRQELSVPVTQVVIDGGADRLGRESPARSRAGRTASA